jgi:hypothetical protein
MVKTHDSHGTEWAKLSELKPYEMVRLDGGFTCSPAGKARLSQDESGLFFQCRDGKHYIAGQADDGEHCVGIYRLPPHQR